jgi:hypothetical protein
MTFRQPVLLLLAITGFFLVLAGLVATGLLDFLAKDGRVDRGDAIGCLVAYCLLVALGALGMAYASRHWRETLVALMATLIALGIVEVALRWTHYPRTLQHFDGMSSTEYHHIYPPNRDMFFGVFEGRTVLVHTNGDGLRSSYTREEFNTYPNRVIMLGDSFVFGYGVRQERGLTAVMERLLRDRLGDKQVAVLNAGIVSYSPFLERLLLAGKLKYYRPTLVVLLLDASDIGDDINYQAEARIDGDRISFDRRAGKPGAYHGALYELVRPWYQYVRGTRPGNALAYPFRQSGKKEYDYYKFTLKVGSVLETDRFFIFRHPLAETRGYFSKTLANIDAVAWEAERMNARFVLAVNPRFQHWNPAEAPDNWEKVAYEVEEPYRFEYFRFFEEARAQVRYPILNLLPAFQATHEFPLLFRNDPHWNERGDAFAARVLVDYLVGAGLIGR